MMRAMMWCLRNLALALTVTTHRRSELAMQMYVLLWLSGRRGRRTTSQNQPSPLPYLKVAGSKCEMSACRLGMCRYIPHPLLSRPCRRLCHPLHYRGRAPSRQKEVLRPKSLPLQCHGQLLARIRVIPSLPIAIYLKEQTSCHQASLPPFTRSHHKPRR